MIKYIVRLLSNTTYEVIKFSNTYINENEYDINAHKEDSVYQGSLSDCAAYISLTNMGLLEIK